MLLYKSLSSDNASSKTTAFTNTVKLLRGNGDEMLVYEIAEPVYRVKRRAGGTPIKAHGWRIVSDGEARAELEVLRATGLYDTERLR